MANGTSGACSTAPKAAIDEQELALSAGMLKALSNPIRLHMVELIRARGGDVCVCEFEQHFRLTQPTISHHLKVLRQSGLIVSRQEGTWVHHTIDERSFRRLRELMDGFISTEIAG